MPNMRLILTNLHDDAQLTATSEALPVTYTQRSGRVRVWRSTDTAEQVITGTFAAGQFLDALVLYRHNLSAAAMVRVELLRGDEVAHDTGNVAASDLKPLGQFRFGIDAWGETETEELPIRQMPFWLPLLRVTGYRITISDTGNSAGYLEVGRIIAGKVVSPKFNASYGLQLEWQDMGEHRRTEGMSLRTVGEGIARRLPFNLDFMDARDRRKFTNEFLRNGKRGDVYISVFPEKGGIDEGEHAFLARRDNNYSHTHDFYQNWKTQITFIEV